MRKEYDFTQGEKNPYFNQLNSTVSLNIQVPAEIRKQAQDIFASLGMDMATAINIFLRHAIAANGMPFDARLNASPQE